MAFEVHIRTDNAAFGETPEERDEELARILEDLARQLRSIASRPGLETHAIGLRDVNGNRVGTAILDPD